jgi:hypothetical protein
MPRVLLWLAAVGFLGFGLAFTLWPLPMARLVEIPLPTPTARIDFAATYGGFELGVGAFLVYCALRPARHRAGLLAAGCALAGFATVRALGLLAVPAAPRPVIYYALALEAASAALAFWAARRAPAPGG